MFVPTDTIAATISLAGLLFSQSQVIFFSIPIGVVGTFFFLAGFLGLLVYDDERPAVA